MTVDPADFPHQLPPVPALLRRLGGQVSVLTDPRHASSIALPVVGDSCAVPAPAPVAKAKAKTKTKKAKAGKPRAGKPRPSRQRGTRKARKPAERRPAPATACLPLAVPDLTRAR